MARFRTVALSAALVAATVAAVGAQAQGTPRTDSTTKAGDWGRGQGPRRGQMGPGERRGAERAMRGPRGEGMQGRPGQKGRAGRGFRPGMGAPGMGRPGMGRMDFIRGLNLTETQRTQVRAIHEKYAPQLKAIRERAQTEFAATRDARQRGDTAAVRAALTRSRQNIESQTSTLHEQIFRDVRAVLTADQRAKVDAKIAERIKKLDEDKARLERLRR